VGSERGSFVTREEKRNRSSRQSFDRTVKKGRWGKKNKDPNLLHELTTEGQSYVVGEKKSAL